MNSLVVLLDESAPSFCGYEPAALASPRRMTRETFESALAFADSHALSLQLLCGRQGVAPFVDELVGQRPHTRYVALGSSGSAESDVLVVDGPRWDEQAMPPGRVPLCVLRIRREELPELAQAWERLSEHVYRVVLVVTDLDRYDEAGLRQYEAALLDVRQRLAAKYLRGETLELSVVSDRLALDAPAECGAGVDHLTVAPSGDLHICPGFARDGEPPVGSLSSGWHIENEELLQRSRAPICGSCDAYHCRRCVYVNRRATLELNIPPWQVCRASHLEREASRLMLDSLHQRRCLEGLRPIAPLDYVDPLHRLMQVRHAVPHGAAAVPREPPQSQARPPAPITFEQAVASAGTDLGRKVGRVTPKERDEIQALHNRKVGLAALLTTLARMDAATLQSSPLYERIVRDMGETTTQYDGWWSSMSRRYRWRRDRPDQTWHVDFETCEVLLD